MTWWNSTPKGRTLKRLLAEVEYAIQKHGADADLKHLSSEMRHKIAETLKPRAKV